MPTQKAELRVHASVTRRIEHLLELKTQRKKLDDEINEVTKVVNDDLADAPDHVIETETFKAQLVESFNSRIDAEELLKLGVRPSIIRRATKKTPYAYPKITAKPPAE